MKRRTLYERLMARVEITDDCWLWNGYVNSRGYGTAYVNGRTREAYRALYELIVGPVPNGLHLDHLCRVTRCVNPYHLEPVTHAENMRRAAAARTHCKNGHEWSEATTYLYQGKRDCRACNTERHRKVGRQVRYRPADVEAWLEARTVETAA